MSLQTTKYHLRQIDSLLGLDIPEETDYWQERAEIPLLTKNIYDEYVVKDGEVQIPSEHVFTLPIDTRGAQQRNPTNMLVCASTGVGKDRIIKNIMKGLQKQNQNILHFEPKGREMLNARYKGTGRRLHPKDQNEKLDVVGYAPNYIKPYIEKNYPELLDEVTFYSPAIEKLDYMEVWQSFGVSPKAAAFIVEMIQKGHYDLDYFQRKVEKLPNLHSASRNSTLSAIETLKATQFFSANKGLALEKEWDKGHAVDVIYMSRDGAMMNTDIGLALDLVRDIGIIESRQGLDNISIKNLVFNDAFYYAGMSATMATRLNGGINLAVRNIQNCQNNFRTWGVNTYFITQSPDSNAIYPALIDGCTAKLVSYIENPVALQNKLPYPAYQLLTNTDINDGPTLYVDEENYTYQWIYVKGKTRWFTGFPLDCSVGSR